MLFLPVEQDQTIRTYFEFTVSSAFVLEMLSLNIFSYETIEYLSWKLFQIAPSRLPIVPTVLTQMRFPWNFVLVKIFSISETVILQKVFCCGFIIEKKDFLTIFCWVLLKPSLTWEWKCHIKIAEILFFFII